MLNLLCSQQRMSSLKSNSDVGSETDAEPPGRECTDELAAAAVDPDSAF